MTNPIPSRYQSALFSAFAVFVAAIGVGSKQTSTTHTSSKVQAPQVVTVKLGRAVGNIVCSYELIISKNAALMCDSGAHEQRVDGCTVVCHTAEVTVLCKKERTN